MRRIVCIGIMVAASAMAQENPEDLDEEIERALRRQPQPAVESLLSAPIRPARGPSSLALHFDSRIADGLLETPLSTGLSYRLGRVDFHLGCSVAVDPARGGTFGSGLRALSFDGEEPGAEALAGAAVTFRFR